MRRLFFTLNAALTLPFGVLGLVAPCPLFAPFDISLDASGELIARGYAATLFGFGLLYWVLRKTTDRMVARAMLGAGLSFNAIEVLIQTQAALSGVAAGVIWVTVGAHAAMILLCVAAFAREPAAGAPRTASPSTAPEAPPAKY